MRTPKIIIKMEGGVIHEIISNVDIDVITLDEDIFDSGDVDGLESFQERVNVSPITIIEDEEEFQERMNQEEESWNDRVDEIREDLEDEDDDDDDEEPDWEDPGDSDVLPRKVRFKPFLPEDREPPKEIPDDLPLGDFM